MNDSDPDISPHEPDAETLFELAGSFEHFVPPCFYRVFHLARVVFSWGRVLDPGARGHLMAVAGTSGDRARREDASGEPTGVPELGGYQVTPEYRRARGFEEVQYADPALLALMEVEELVQAAEERELWVRVPRRQGEARAAEEVSRLVEGGSQDALNDAEQKLYVLLDKSVSMRADYRLMYAKALILWFLGEKYRHGANPMLFFRGFAARVTPLARATRKRDIPKVVRAMLEVEPDEKGTNIQLALMTAIDDIQRASMMHDAQILLVSDGLDILDTDVIREAAGEDIRIHMVKLGSDDIDPTDAEMKDLAERFNIRVEHKDDLKKVFVDRIYEQFDAITDTFMEVPDVGAGALDVPPEELARLADMAERRVLSREPGDPTADDAHRAAVFLTHTLDALRAHVVEEQRKPLDELQDRLNDWIRRRVADPDRLREALAAKNLNLVLEKNAMEETRKDRAFDVQGLLAGEELALALRLWKRAEGQGLGVSIPWWWIAKALIKKVFNRK